jgi:hypothetical protein
LGVPLIYGTYVVVLFIGLCLSCAETGLIIYFAILKKKLWWICFVRENTEQVFCFFRERKKNMRVLTEDNLFPKSSLG